DPQRLRRFVNLQRYANTDQLVLELMGALRGERPVLEQRPADGLARKLIVGGEDDDAAVLFHVEADPRVVAPGAAGVGEQLHARWLQGTTVMPGHGGLAEGAEAGDVRRSARVGEA